MNNPKKQYSKSETLSFAAESPQEGQPSPNKSFKLLIVDDENEIHVMTKLVLNDYQYQEYGLEFISAFSGAEAKKVIQDTPDIACCLLDVVMETKDAGLEVARFIREELNNTKIRIVLRTGQPGKAPEKDVILNYDINDYKEKTELTNQKLFTTITTALRSYIHLVELEEKNKEIQSKNIRLNEEIARRIVAESNLTKYNRSLERMIESKTQRLKEALSTLEATEKQLMVTQKAAIVSDLSAASLDSLTSSNEMIRGNLSKMTLYRQQITFLLEKYNTLEAIITSHQGTRQELEEAARAQSLEIEAYKSEIDLDTILEKYPKIIQDSIEGIQKIADAINDIKLFVAINDEPHKSIDLNTLVREISGKLTYENQRIDIQLDLQDIPKVTLPEHSISQAFEAVVDNAFKAVTTQGIISISSRYEDPWISITVSDIGVGIPQEAIEKIFTPYYTGWQNGHKGLGLSFAKSTILSCGGDIKVTSTATEGTTVVIYLPSQTPSPEIQPRL
ncbi:MAG: ATP-binding protein [Desulfobacterales bacterium]|nr:ATP-binding protein [Desulfobacterales bacterium]